MMDDTRDEQARPRTAAATEARQTASDEKMAERLRERGWIVFRHDPKSDPIGDGSIGRQLKDLIDRRMAYDACQVAFFAGQLTGAKMHTIGETTGVYDGPPLDRLTVLPNDQVEHWYQEVSTGKTFRWNGKTWVQVPCTCGASSCPIHECPTPLFGDVGHQVELPERQTIPQIIRTALDKQQEFLTGSHIPCKPEPVSVDPHDGPDTYGEDPRSKRGRRP